MSDPVTFSESTSNDMSHIFSPKGVKIDSEKFLVIEKILSRDIRPLEASLGLRDIIDDLRGHSLIVLMASVRQTRRKFVFDGRRRYKMRSRGWRWHSRFSRYSQLSTFKHQFLVETEASSEAWVQYWRREMKMVGYTPYNMRAVRWIKTIEINPPAKGNHEQFCLIGKRDSFTCYPLSHSEWSQTIRPWRKRSRRGILMSGWKGSWSSWKTMTLRIRNVRVRWKKW